LKDESRKAALVAAAAQQALRQTPWLIIFAVALFLMQVATAGHHGRVVVDQVAEQIRVGVPIPTSIDATLVKSA
jgi:hypothetical protein